MRIVVFHDRELLEVYEQPEEVEVVVIDWSRVCTDAPDMVDELDHLLDTDLDKAIEMYKGIFAEDPLAEGAE